MKKNILVFLSILILPILVFAKDYNEFDIRFKEEIGTNVKNNEIQIFVKVDEEEKFVDHTEDFTLEDVKWYKYKSEIEEGKTEEDYDYYDNEKKMYGYLVNDEDVFEEDYKYLLIISRLYAQEEDSFSRNVLINGVNIDDMDGQCFNTGNEFYIKTIARGDGGINEQEDEPVIETNDENDNVEKQSCPLNIPLCCITFLGISLCIWIIIAILLIILVIVLISKKNSKK